jgi:hypothetical protein
MDLPARRVVTLVLAVVYQVSAQSEQRDGSLLRSSPRSHAVAEDQGEGLSESADSERRWQAASVLCPRDAVHGQGLVRNMGFETGSSRQNALFCRLIECSAGTAFPRSVIVSIEQQSVQLYSRAKAPQLSLDDSVRSWTRFVRNSSIISTMAPNYRWCRIRERLARRP